MAIRFLNMRRVARPLSLAAATILAASAFAATAQGSSPTATWPTGGQNLDNSRSQPMENTIGSANVANLAPKSGFATAGAFSTGGGDVSATPAVDVNRVYFPASNGKLFAVNRSNGSVAWSLDIADLTGIKPSNGATGSDYARATPALAGQVLIIGTQSGKFQTPDFAAAHPDLKGAYVLGIDKATGALLWKTKVDDHFAAIVTQSAQVYGNTAFVGLASNEEAFANQDLSGGIPYTCCTFRGKLVALDVKTGQIKWQTYMLPNEPGYSGDAIWGSTPAVDPQRNSVYVTTGNNYSLPADRITCVDEATTFEAKQACLPGNQFDAIVSLNMKTGAINWSYRALASDAWNTDCGLPGFSEGGTNPGNCPTDAGPDYDFGQGPMLLKAKIGGKLTDVVGAGEKSGDFMMLNRDTGALLWKTHVGPGGLTGGLQWGSATDGKRVYVAESNSANPSVRGYWSALNPATGAELWRTYDPGTGIGGEACAFFPGCTWSQVGIAFGYSAQGPVSVANGVVFACSLNPVGANMVAMDAATGAIKWTFASGSSCLGGAAIVNGTVYWGTGYRSFAPLTTAGDKLFAFTLNGQ
ncbi:putative Pyrrolo-quinoline quinone repeat-containing protein [metagenome]|uniref:Putative Pyrrolo-quinoline quinone repeat-containing protein n=1 Tax=metagenome TaxID=256318 RepID=A0A2P2C1C0_9ZZZZ